LKRKDLIQAERLSQAHLDNVLKNILAYESKDEDKDARNQSNPDQRQNKRTIS